LDLKDPTIPMASNSVFLKADLLTIPEKALKDWAGEVDLVLSDLAPNTCGVKWLDHQRSLDLNQRALEVAVMILTRGGSAVFKLFDGEGTRDFIKKINHWFEQSEMHKPKSSRQESTEIYLVSGKFKGRIIK
jgi:23S rRNA (uridine2552-2'-O)-methyltransferase